MVPSVLIGIIEALKEDNNWEKLVNFNRGMARTFEKLLCAESKKEKATFDEFKKSDWGARIMENFHNESILNPLVESESDGGDGQAHVEIEMTSRGSVTIGVADGLADSHPSNRIQATQASSEGQPRPGEHQSDQEERLNRDSHIPMGTRVELCDLQSKPELNGQQGVVTNFVPSSGRYSVLLDDGRGPYAFKSKNLLLCGGGGGGVESIGSRRSTSTWGAAAHRRLSFIVSTPPNASEDKLCESGVVINKLTSDLKWVERRLMVDEEFGALKISTQKLLAAETHIPLTSIAYVQVGAEELEEQYRKLEEPLKTLNNSKTSLYISAGEASVRIRLADEEAAASLAVEIRELARGAHDSITKLDTSGRDEEGTPEEAGLLEEKSHGGADDEDEDDSDDRRSAVVTFEDGMDYDRGTEIIRADTGSERQLEGAGENPLLQGRGEK